MEEVLRAQNGVPGFYNIKYKEGLRRVEIESERYDSEHPERYHVRISIFGTNDKGVEKLISTTKPLIKGEKFRELGMDSILYKSKLIRRKAHGRLKMVEERRHYLNKKESDNLAGVLAGEFAKEFISQNHNEELAEV